MNAQLSIRLCIVTPIGNEKSSICQFLDQVKHYLTVEDRMLLIIDNVSVDGTREIVQQYLSEPGNEHILLIEAPENRCVADAYIRGYREALKLNPKWILEMDAGFSHQPKHIPEFVALMEQGYDYAGGSRFLKGAQYNGGPYRRLLSQGGTWVAKMLLDCELSDMTSGYQCYSRETLSRILERGIFSKGGFFQTEIRYFVSKLKWAEIPITYDNVRQSVPFRYVADGVTGLIRLVKNSRCVS